MLALARSEMDDQPRVPGEDRRSGDRYIFEQLSRVERELMVAINGMRDRHHDAINHLAAQSMQVFAEMAAMRVDVSNIKTQLLEHTHPEMARIHDSLSSQISELKKEIAVDRAAEAATEKTKISTKATIAWTLGAVGTVFGIILAIITIVAKV